MMYGFNTAVRGLLASQRSLYTTNHNIDNANTKGYSRQQASQRATKAFELPGIGFQGSGTEIYDIKRVRDSFVDFKYWNESAPAGEWGVKKANLTEIEKLMGEPTNNSFRQYMDDFYTSLEDMSKNPSDVAFREPVRENALAFTKHLNETAQRLQNMKKDTEYEIEIKVDYVNSLTGQIAGLNRQIYLAEVSGKAANDLRDRRELLVDDLSQIVNVRVNESPDGKYDVSLGGITIVDHLHSNKMAFNEVKDEITGIGIGEFKLTWENGGNIKLNSGELKGLIDILTGNGSNNTYRGLPYFEEKLDDFAREYATKFNAQHNLGKTADGNNGIDFFVGAGNLSTDIKATTITINEDILKDISKIAAGGEDGIGSAEDANNILELIKQRDDKYFFQSADGLSQGTPDDFIKSMLSSMAVDSLQAQRAYATQETIQKNIASKRDSISGVSLNEEMADMVKFQHVYVAASKMISTMDMLLDLTVNRLGLVGR